MHPAKNVVVHVDLQRVIENEQIRLKLPIHFKGESISPRESPGRCRSHMRGRLKWSRCPRTCRVPRLDLSGMSLNETKFLSDISAACRCHDSELSHRNAR